MWVFRSVRSDFSRLSTGICCWCLCSKSASHSDFCRDTFCEFFVFERNKSSTAFLMNDGFLDNFFFVFGEKDSSRSTLEFMASDELRKPTTKHPLSYAMNIKSGHFRLVVLIFRGKLSMMMTLGKEIGKLSKMSKFNGIFKR